MGVKPCPFCGNYPVIERLIEDPEMYGISCRGLESNKLRIGDLTTECDTNTFIEKGLMNAIRVWNMHYEENKNSKGGLE